MTKRNHFLGDSSVLPSPRWRDAFPDGMVGDFDMLMASAGPGDLVWVPTAHAGWETDLQSLGRALPDCVLVVLSYAPNDSEAESALKHGARGYCHALSVPTLFRDAALVLQHGGLWVGRELMAKVVSTASRLLSPPGGGGLLNTLSYREAEVVRAAVAGKSNKEIAEALGITERTVKAHMGAVFEKLGVRDRLQLVLRLSASASLEKAE